jgi:hypothetical protein
MIVANQQSLREKIINLVKGVPQTEGLVEEIQKSYFMSFAVLPEERDRLDDFAKQIGRPISSMASNFFYTSVGKYTLDKLTAATPQGLLLHVNIRFKHISTHKVDSFFFLQLLATKHLNLQKTTITL